MKYSFAALATKPTTLLSPPLKVLFLRISHAPSSTPMARTSIFQEYELED
jgi:hypothetical protein